VLVGIGCAGTGIEAVPHPAIRIPASIKTTDRTGLDMPVYAPTALHSDPSLLPCKLGNRDAALDA